MAAVDADVLPMAWGLMANGSQVASFFANRRWVLRTGLGGGLPGKQTAPSLRRPIAATRSCAT